MRCANRYNDSLSVFNITGGLTHLERPPTRLNTDWKDGFLFLANQLALDFINTRPVQDGGVIELLPDFEALLRWFRAADILTLREVGKLQQRWGDSVRTR